MKKLLFLFASVIFFTSCQQNNPQPNKAPTTGSLDYTVNDTTVISSQGVYYFTVPSVACATGGFTVTQPNVANRGLSVLTFTDDLNTGAVIVDSTMPACTFTRALKGSVIEYNKTYLPYVSASYRSWIKITQNANGLISGTFNIKGIGNINANPNDTVNVVGTFTDFTIITP